MSRVVTHTNNFPCIGCDETDFHLGSTTWSSNFTSSSYKYDNLKTVASSTSYARINVDKTVSSTSYIYALFDFSSIPSGATITNTIGKIRLYANGS
jgi:Ni,Fe-hydrogenase I small subunit